MPLFPQPVQACRQEQIECVGFSRGMTGKPRRLKPFSIVAFGGIAEAMS